MCSDLNIKSPLAGKGAAQKIAAVALLLLALIAGISVLGHQSGSSTAAPESSPSGFTPQTYTPTASASQSNGSKRPSTGADGLAVISYAQLPKEGRDTVNLIDAGGPFPYARDGIVFSNAERILPQHPRGWYHEYTVKTPGEKDRGARRIIQGQDKTMYYTADHYASFKRIQR